MSEALHLFPLPPVLTERQEMAYSAIVAAGYDGLASDELGALIHAWQAKHPTDQTCEWCPSVGLELGRALRVRGLVQQRRRRAPSGDVYMVWTVAGKLPRPVVRDYGLPEGY